jgi:ABC-type glycerol-3-phosphate transport system substrate-binding protein
MRLIHTSLFAAIAALGLAACGQQPAAPQTETPPAAPADGATTEPAAAPAPRCWWCRMATTKDVTCASSMSMV